LEIYIKLTKLNIWNGGKVMKNCLKNKSIMGGIFVVCVGLCVVFSGCLTIHVDENFDDNVADDWLDDDGKWNVHMLGTNGVYCWKPTAPPSGWPERTYARYGGWPGRDPGFTNFSMQLEGIRYKQQNPSLDLGIGIFYRFIGPFPVCGVFLVNYTTQRWCVYQHGNPDIKIVEGYAPEIIDKDTNIIEVSGRKVMPWHTGKSRFTHYINGQEVHQYYTLNLPLSGGLGIYAIGYQGDEIHVDNVRIYWDHKWTSNSQIFSENSEFPNQRLQHLYQIIKDRYPLLEKLITSRQIINKIFNIT
jgi:hypothetical protein